MCPYMQPKPHVDNILKKTLIRTKSVGESITLYTFCTPGIIHLTILYIHYYGQWFTVMKDEWMLLRICTGLQFKSYGIFLLLNACP